MCDIIVSTISQVSAFKSANNRNRLLIEQLNYREKGYTLIPSADSLLVIKAVLFLLRIVLQSRGCYCTVGDTVQSTACFLNNKEDNTLIAQGALHSRR